MLNKSRVEEVLEVLKGLPVFSFSEYAKLLGNSYAKESLRRLIKRGIVYRVRRDSYTLYDDPLLIAPFLYRPSYIGGYSALHLQGLLDQIPKDILCFTSRPPTTITAFNTIIHYKHTGGPFHYTFLDYRGFKLPIAIPEKAFAETIGLLPLSLIIPAFKELNKDRLVEIIPDLPSGTQRRIAYLLSREGINIDIKISKRTLLLDPLGPKEGTIDKRFNIIRNVRI